MRVLIDECINPRIREAFTGHEARTDVEMGWGGITNGKLMKLASGSFDVFVTMDRNLQYQQNLKQIPLGIVVVVVPDNSMRWLRPLFGEMLRATEAVGAGEVIEVGA